MNKEIKGLDTDNVKTSFICPQKYSRGVNMLLPPQNTNDTFVLSCCLTDRRGYYYLLVRALSGVLINTLNKLLTQKGGQNNEEEHERAR